MYIYTEQMSNLTFDFLKNFQVFVKKIIFTKVLVYIF